MSWFDSDAVKQLKKDSQFIGGLIADQAFGALPPEAAEEMIQSETQRENLRRAFDAVARELGPQKALKKASDAAGDHARMKAQVRSVRWQEVERAAEAAIRDMLATARPE